jgi:hypothetical protein
MFGEASTLVPVNAYQHWLFTAEVSFGASREREKPGLRVSRYHDWGELLEAASRMADREGSGV